MSFTWLLIAYKALPNPCGFHVDTCLFKSDDGGKMPARYSAYTNAASHAEQLMARSSVCVRT
jgi:hypothetical protein